MIRRLKLAKVSRLLVVIENNLLVELTQFGHKFIADCQLPIGDCRFDTRLSSLRRNTITLQVPRPPNGNWQSAIYNQLKISITLRIVAASTSTSAFVL